MKKIKNLLPVLFACLVLSSTAQQTTPTKSPAKAEPTLTKPVTAKRPVPKKEPKKVDMRMKVPAKK